MYRYLYYLYAYCQCIRFLPCYFMNYILELHEICYQVSCEHALLGNVYSGSELFPVYWILLPWPCIVKYHGYCLYVFSFKNNANNIIYCIAFNNEQNLSYIIEGRTFNRLFGRVIMIVVPCCILKCFGNCWYPLYVLSYYKKYQVAFFQYFQCWILNN